MERRNEKTNLDIFDSFPLQSQREKDTALHTREFHLVRESLRKVERGKSREKIENNVIIEHVVGVGFESFQIEGREKLSYFVRRQSCRARSAIDESVRKRKTNKVLIESYLRRWLLPAHSTQ